MKLNKCLPSFSCLRLVNHHMTTVMSVTLGENMNIKLHFTSNGFKHSGNNINQYHDHNKCTRLVGPIFYYSY